MMSLKVVITGASKGIGKALAHKFAAQGCALALCARQHGPLQQLKDELAQLPGALPQHIHTFTCDVSKKDEVQNFARQVLKLWGSADILINNAGVFFPGLVHREEEGTLETVIETNLYSAYHLSRALLPAMMERRSGHIFNLCSVASIKAYPNGGAYTISKFALLGFSKSLREEMKEYNIRVTALIPGATYTPSWQQSGLPEERFMKADDVADLVWSIHQLSGNTVVEEVLLRPMLGDI